MKELTIIYHAEITEVLKNVPDDYEQFSLTVKGEEEKALLGVDDLRITDFKVFERDMKKNEE